MDENRNISPIKKNTEDEESESEDDDDSDEDSGDDTGVSVSSDEDDDDHDSIANEDDKGSIADGVDDALLPTECACRHGDCQFAVTCQLAWSKKDRPNIRDSKHGCCKCGARISGLCLKEDEQISPGCLFCANCYINPADVSKVTDKESTHSGSTKKSSLSKDSYYEDIEGNLPRAEKISEVFTYHNILPLKSKYGKSQEATAKSWTCVKAHRGYKLFVGVVRQERKQKPKNIVYDPIQKTFHHVCQSYLSLPSPDEVLPEISGGAINAIENFVTNLFQQLKTGEEFPETLLKPLKKETTSVRKDKPTGVAGNLMYNISVIHL